MNDTTRSGTGAGHAPAPATPPDDQLPAYGWCQNDECEQLALRVELPDVGPFMCGCGSELKMRPKWTADLWQDADLLIALREIGHARLAVQP